MFSVTFLVNGEPRTVQFEPGTLEYRRDGRPGSLLDVALNFGVPLEHTCGGNAACTTCHVIVREGMQNLSGMEDGEADRLDGAWDLTPDSRLACQAIVRGDVVCEIPAHTRNYVAEDGHFDLGRKALSNPESPIPNPGKDLP
jgi:2Fe-2S ferredoxin